MNSGLLRCDTAGLQVVRDVPKQRVVFVDMDNLENKCDKSLRNVANSAPITTASYSRRWKLSITLLRK